MMGAMRLPPVLFLAGLILLAACGGGGSDSAPTTTTSPPPSTAPTPAGVPTLTAPGRENIAFYYQRITRSTDLSKLGNVSLVVTGKTAGRTAAVAIKKTGAQAYRGVQAYWFANGNSYDGLEVTKRMDWAFCLSGSTPLVARTDARGVKWYFLDSNEQGVRQAFAQRMDDLKKQGWNGIFFDRGFAAMTGRDDVANPAWDKVSTCTQDPVTPNATLSDAYVGMASEVRKAGLDLILNYGTSPFDETVPMRPDPRDPKCQAKQKGCKTLDDVWPEVDGVLDEAVAHPKDVSWANDFRSNSLNEQMSHQGKNVVGLLTQGTMGGQHSRDVAYYEWARGEALHDPARGEHRRRRLRQPGAGRALQPAGAVPRAGQHRVRHAGRECAAVVAVHVGLVGPLHLGPPVRERHVARERLADHEADGLAPARRHRLSLRQGRLHREAARRAQGVRDLGVVQRQGVVRTSAGVQRESLVARADPVEARPDTETHGERVAAYALIAFTLLFAFIVQSLFFHTSADMHGDVAYHRGVGLEMLGGDFQGQGPFHHLLAYFGGLYPLGLAYGSHWLGVSFDGFLSVVSWFATLALPLVFLWLGRNIWPRRWLEPALLAFLGTVGSSLAVDNQLIWVKSVLPSGANLWPLYPRDIALVLVIAALAVMVGGRTLKRAAVVGVILAVVFCVHAQLGFYGIAIVASYGLWMAWRDQLRAWVAQVSLSTVLAFGLSAWWWWPRLHIVLDTRTLLLKSWPGRPSPPLSPWGILVALGMVGVLAVPGIVLTFRRRDRTLRYAATWLAVSIPLALAASALGDAGLITDRRVWLFAAIPMLICATIGATAIVRKAPFVPALLVIVALVAVPSFREAQRTLDTVNLRWGVLERPNLYADADWNPVFDELRDEVIQHGNRELIAPDGDADFVWTETGAQPFSLWLPGSIKLGFDPKDETGLSYLERLKISEAAFHEGLGGLCRLASRRDAALVLRHDGSLLGTRDVRPSAKYRVDPKDRVASSLTRVVGHDIVYEDRNDSEALVLYPGATLPVGFSGPRIKMVDVLLEPRYPDVFANPRLTLRLPDGTEIHPTQTRLDRNSFRLRYRLPDGLPAGSTLNTQDRVSIVRMIGYEPVAGFHGIGSGPVVVNQAAVCPGR